MNKPQPYTAKLADKIQLNEKYWLFKFELVEPAQLQFEAGQYVSIQVDDQGCRRSYSIASTPRVDHGFELLVDVSPQGIGCKFLQNLTPGSEVNIIGPMGHFVLQEEPQEPELFFIATGSGLAPFYSMLLELLQGRQDQRKITLYWGMRFENDLFWLEEFEQLMTSFPNFKLNVVLSQPGPEWTLDRGHVTESLMVHGFNKQAGFYLCGNAKMIEEVNNQLLQAGVKLEQIHFEKFY